MAKQKKLFRIYDIPLKKYVAEVGFKFGESEGYRREIFTRKQARQYIEAVNHVRTHYLKKEEHEYKLEEVK